MSSKCPRLACFRRKRRAELLTLSVTNDFSLKADFCRVSWISSFEFVPRGKAYFATTMIGRAAVLYVVIALANVISAEGSEALKRETNTESLHPSSHGSFENFAASVATETLRPGSTEHASDILTTSQDTKLIPTSAFSTATPQTNTEISSTPTSTTELPQTTDVVPTAKPSLDSTSGEVNATHHLSSPAETPFSSSEFMLPSSDITQDYSFHTSIWIPLSSEVEIGSAQLNSTLFENTATVLWSPTAIEDLSSTAVSQSAPSQQVGPTKTSAAESSSTPKSVTDRPPSRPTTAKSATSAPKSTPVKNSGEQLSPGAKIAVGVIVTLCILGVVLAAVVLYRRFNLTHRSLKSFLTSGVRYKTYKNATYKDDEGMLIMPDRR